MSSTSLAVRLAGSRSDCGANRAPPNVAVDRCSAKGPTGHASIGVEPGAGDCVDHRSSSDPSRVAAPVLELTVPRKSLMATARTVSHPSAASS